MNERVATTPASLLAVCSFKGSISGTIGHYLKATDFGFTIPGGAIIQGIQLDVEQKQTGSGASAVAHVDHMRITVTYRMPTGFNPSGCVSGGQTKSCSLLDPAPLKYRVQLSGIINGPECEQCDGLNDDHILDHISGCLWRRVFDEVCPSTWPTIISFNILSPSSAELTVGMGKFGETRYETSVVPLSPAQAVRLSLVFEDVECPNFPDFITVEPI